MRRLIPLTLACALLGACRSNPYCLDCLESGTDASASDAGSIDALFAFDLTSPADLLGQPCQTSNDGVEICDGLDNDCNGTVDDVVAAKLAKDPNHCGACGVVCDFTAQKQFGVCDDSSGTP